MGRNPQTWNCYAYVMNNPLSFIDPSGLACYSVERNLTGCNIWANLEGYQFGSNWNEFDVLGIILGPGQTSDVTAKINGVPISETLTYYSGDLSLLNLIGNNDSWWGTFAANNWLTWTWNFTKALVKGPSTGTGSCLALFGDTVTAPLKQLRSAAQTYVPALVSALQAAPYGANGFAGYMRMVGNFSSTPAAETEADIAALNTAAAGAAAAAPYVSAAAPYAITGGTDAVLLKGVVSEVEAGWHGQCSW